MTLTFTEAIADAEILGAGFQGPSWAAWRAFGRVGIDGMPPLDAVERALVTECTGRTDLGSVPITERWILAGRRAAKSKTAAAVAVYCAALRDYRAVLAPGERPTVLVIAADRKQARVAFGYIKAHFDAPLLRGLVAREREDSLDLSNGVSIEVGTASYRTIRGYTVVCAILDEVAFWRSEDAAEPDTEIVAALRPAMATVPGALLLGVSSPYARRGVLWRAYSRHYGVKGSPVLVWRAATRTMNPSIPQSVVDEALAEDEPAARAEWLAEFRRDVESFLTREVVEACVVPGRRELPPCSGARYAAFCDPSGGSVDAFTLALAHAEDAASGPRAVLDLLRERQPPFSPAAVVADFAETLRAYGCAEVTGDRYGGAWVAEAFARHGIAYRPAERSRSELYAEMLPAVNAARVDLLDEPRLVAQLCALERRTARGGRDSIDHAPGAHDDLANAAAGAVSLVLGRRPVSLDDLFGDDSPLAQAERAGALDDDDETPWTRPPALSKPGRGGTFQ